MLLFNIKTIDQCGHYVYKINENKLPKSQPFFWHMMTKLLDVRHHEV